jgi:DNA polymerase-4
MKLRAVLHVDMDAFYASVEERDRPELKGRPLIVGGFDNRGVVAAANYAVRRFGVRSAMPMREALRRCPEAVCIPPRMSRYQEMSGEIFEILREWTPLVEGLSLDEAFLDVTACRRLKGSAEQIGADIRQRIRTKTGLAASVGVAPNKLLAKIASDLAKPDGLFCIGADNLHAVLDPLPIDTLPGVGAKTTRAVFAAGIRTVGDLRAASDAMVWRAFGKDGPVMRQRAAGIDDRPVVPHREEKSLSAERTFAADSRDARALKSELLHLVDRAATRLRAHGLAASRLTVKIRRSDFATYTRQRTIEPATQDTAVLCRAAAAVFDEWRRGQPQAALRLLGIALGDLELPRQGDLFARTPQTGSPLDQAVDEVRRRFGAGLLTPASRLAEMRATPRKPDSGPRRDSR